MCNCVVCELGWRVISGFLSFLFYSLWLVCSKYTFHGFDFNPGQLFFLGSRAFLGGIAFPQLLYVYTSLAFDHKDTCSSSISPTTDSHQDGIWGAMLWAFPVVSPLPPWGTRQSWDTVWQPPLDCRTLHFSQTAQRYTTQTVSIYSLRVLKRNTNKWRGTKISKSSLGISPSSK